MLTPDNIRQVARIRLAYKRLDRHVLGLDVIPGEPIDDMNGRIATLVGQFLDDLDYAA